MFADYSTYMPLPYLGLDIELYYGKNISFAVDELIEKNVHILDSEQISLLRSLTNSVNFTFNIPQANRMLAYMTRSEDRLLPNDTDLVFIATALETYVEENLDIEENIMFRTRVTSSIYKYIKEWLTDVTESEKINFKEVDNTNYDKFTSMELFFGQKEKGEKRNRDFTDEEEDDEDSSSEDTRDTDE